MRKLPSPWSIIWTDNAYRGITIIAPVLCLMALVITLTGTISGSRSRPDTPVDPDVASMVLACAVALILFLSATVALRVARIRSLFHGGREVEARVRKVNYFRGGAGQKLELEFELDGIPYKVSSAFLRSSRTPAFSEGTRISLLVDRVNPNCAIPLALYADPARPTAASADLGGAPKLGPEVESSGPEAPLRETGLQRCRQMPSRP